MSKFKKDNKGDVPAVSTASLPDIVFMLLIFLMVSTVLRESDLKIEVTVPGATDVKKLEDKSVVKTIFIGKPFVTYQKLFGSEPRIQINDAFAEVDEVRTYIVTAREGMKEADQPRMMVSLKIDKNTKMGIVTDVKQELRKAQALLINYSANEVEKVY